MKSTVEDGIEGLLKRKNLKVTEKRVSLLRLIRQSSSPMSAEDIHQALRGGHVGLNLSSVYRNLETLCLSGLVIRTTDHEGKRAIYQDASNIHRHCFVCIGCNRVIPIQECPLEEFQKKHSELNRFKAVSHRIEIFGYCEYCQNIGSL